MKKLLLFTLFAVIVLQAGAQNAYWKARTGSFENELLNKGEVPSQNLFNLDVVAFKKALLNAPKRENFFGKSNVVVEFPSADGAMQRYRIKEVQTMAPELAAKYPGIKSYIGEDVSSSGATIRFSVSHLGVQAMKMAPGTNMMFIEPVSKDRKTYSVFTRNDRKASLSKFECLVEDDLAQKVKNSNQARPNADDATLRTYRLAVSATGEYTAYFGGTKADALAAINTTLTRVNGVFENDFAITLVLIANTDLVIYTSAASDPYSTTSSQWNGQLQTTLTNNIGEANYDVGHLFQRAQNNGNAGCIGCVCINNQKGRGWTSRDNPVGDVFDIDYVAHELGHQFGGNHTWTHGGNEGRNVQMEPGSGSTIMGYAGITGATDVQPNSDPYFHAISIQQVTNYVKATTCQTNTPTGNAIPTALAGPDYTIPKGTPFMLTGSSTDANGDSLTYCWEQMDENDAATTNPSTTATTGVAFRSFLPSSSPTRMFPRLETIKTGATSWQWEAVPGVARSLNFRLTVRDNRPGGAANNSDDVLITVNGVAGPFALTAPNTAVSWAVGSTQTVTWNVAGTTGNGVNAANVDILLSTDGGNTYPITLASAVPNDGSHDIVVPDNQGTQNRVMVKGSNHIFFDISNANFTISGAVACNATVPTGLASSGITSNSTTLTWNEVPGATYDVQYRVVGSSTWTTVSSTTNSINLTGLAATTQYEAQVNSKCSGGATSAFSAIVNFTTTNVQLNYCASNGNNTSDEYIGRVQLGSINNPSAAGAGGYSDFTSISTGLTAGNAYTVTVTPTWPGTVYAEGYSVWIDYNQDGDFTDAGEQVFTRTATTATPVSGSFTVPTTATVGNTRMRVSMKYNAVPTACESFTYGEVEDYTVVISGAAPDTQAPTVPTNLSASAVTQTSFTLSWSASTDNVGVTSYTVFQNGVSIGTSATTSFNVTGLSAGTTYGFSVSASDAAGNTSANSATLNVTAAAAPTCTDGIQNGDETGVDCGGSSCAPCQSSSVLLHEGYFETGLDGWTDGGADCARYFGTRSFEGNYSVYVRDNSGIASAMTSPVFNLTPYDTVEFKFYFYAVSMENGEDFWVRYFNGSTWSTVATYAAGSSFNNLTFYSATVTLDRAQVNFPTNAQFRVQADASDNSDLIYVDQVTVTGISGGRFARQSSEPLVVGYGRETGEGISAFLLYPNPVKEGFLNVIKPADVQANYRIVNLLGQTVKTGLVVDNRVDVSSLKAGVYLFELNDGEETQIERFVKQ